MERGLIWTGAGAAVLAIVSAVVLGDADTASRASVRVSSFIFVLSVALFVAFAAVVAAQARERTSRYSVVALAATSGALQIAGVLPRLALTYRSTLSIGTDTQRLVLDLGRVTNFSSDVILAAFLAIASVALADAVPSFQRWSYVGYAGAAAALVAAASISDAAGLLTLAALVAWLVAGSVTLARHHSTPVTHPR